MLPSVTITLPPETVAFLARLQAWPRALTRAVIATLNNLNEETVGHIAEHRATGKGPFPVSEGKLGAITNFYRRNLHRNKATIEGSTINSSIGDNMRYAGAHEFGFNETVAVKEHTRRIFGTFTTGGGMFADPRTGKLRKQRKRKVEMQTGSVQVKAHQMRMHIPARAPIRRGIEDRLPLYGPALGNAIVAALSAGGAS